MKDQAVTLFQSEKEVIAYAQGIIPQLGSAEQLICTEIGDGNLNFVYRVKNAMTGASVIIKQAGDFARSTQDYKLTIDRNRIEAEVIRYYGTLTPTLVPKVYHYDADKHCYLMEDLGDYEIFRKALLKREINSVFSDQIATFLANVLLKTSCIGMEPMQKREMEKRYANPELCKISEDLVFTDPFTDAGGTNRVFEPNRDYVEREVYGDTELRLEAAKLKSRYLNQSEALIHGDLHTGSIFVRPDSIKVIDPEFAFYGPAGYDVGNVIGNLAFAYINAAVTMDDGVEKKTFLTWLNQTIGEVIDLFCEKFLQGFAKEATDVMMRTDGFAEWYLAGVLSDTAGIAGLEMLRRTVGEAGVEEIRGIDDVQLRCSAERYAIQIGKRLVKERDVLNCGADYRRVLAEVLQQ